MRVLYVAYRHDPRDPDLASGSDYNFFQAIKQTGLETKLVGPFSNEAHTVERAVRKLYRSRTRKKYAKFTLSLAWLVSKEVNRSTVSWDPDLIFTLFPPGLVFYSGKVPTIFRLDTTFLGQEQEWPLYGGLALNLSVWQEKRVFSRCARVITHSDWSKHVLIQDYGLDTRQVEVFPNPAALPRHVIPSLEEIQTKALELPLRLLLVGREYKRKGVSIAIEIVRQLNAQGVAADLTVCGTTGIESPFVKFVGPYQKSNPRQLQQYVDLYRNAHFLLHPALFEAAGIVPSEAAAFGTPTITNNVGGLATTVKDGESGVVLPKDSPAEAYTNVILSFLKNPESYYDLCYKARQRYERELNWDVAGKRIGSIIREVVQEK